MRIDKASPIPLYYQLAEILRERIESGALKPGDQLPSERELGEQNSISRMTVRQAITYLAQKGTLIIRPGVGTFVAEPKFTYDALHLLGFTEEMMAQGRVVSSRVLEQEIVTPPAGIATQLGLKPNAKTVKIVRLRLEGEVTPFFYDGRPDPDRKTRHFTLWLDHSPTHLPLRIAVPLGPANLVIRLNP